MEVSVEEKGLFDRIITVRVGAERVGTWLDEEIARLSGTVKMSGFRPGKIPKQLLESRFRDHLAAGAADQLFRESYPKALEQVALRPVDSPIVDAGKIARGTDFTYSATLQIFPEAVATGYDGLALSRIVAHPAAENVDKVLRRIQEEQGEFKREEGRRAGNGDQLKLDFSGTIDGDPFEGGSAEGFMLVLGKGHFIPGFEDQLIGVAAGEERIVRATFPDNYSTANLAGKEAVFLCTIQEVHGRHLPELNDALAEKAGVAEGGMEKLRQGIVNDLQAEATRKSDQLLKEEIVDKLFAANAMELPSRMVEREAKEMAERVRMTMQSRGMDPTKVGIFEEAMEQPFNFREMAVKRLTLGVVISAIVGKEGIRVSNEAVERQLDRITARFGSKASTARREMRGNEERMSEIRAGLLEHQAMEWIVEHANIVETESDFETLIGKKGTAE